MVIIYTTVATKKEADKIADVLVEERLCACVNIWPVRSVYRWNPPDFTSAKDKVRRARVWKIERAAEWALLCKTRKALAGKAEARILKLHSYNMPVIEQWEVKKVSKGVREWIDEATR